MPQEKTGFPRRTPETRAKGRMVPAQGRLPGLKDRSRLLSDETQKQQGLTPRLPHPLRVVDGGKARIILGALVTPFEVTQNQPMLDLLWRTSFRWKIAPRQVTGDTAYGTTENIAAVERAGIRAYVPLTGAGKARPYFSKEEFVYDPKQDLYQCAAGNVLRPKTFRAARNQVPLQDRAWHLRLLLDETPMHRQQDRAPSAAPPRRALRGSGQELPWHLRLRESTAQEAGMGGAVVR